MDSKNHIDDQNIVLCASIYHIFVALMVIYSRKIADNSFILLTTHEKEQFEHFQRILPRLEKLGIPCELRLRNKKHELLGIEFLKTKEQYKRVISRIGTSKFHFINFSWNFSGPFRTSISWYKASASSEFFEEGAMCYATPRDKNWKKTIKHLIGIREDFYKDEKLERIYVQRPEFFPEEYADKTETINLKKLADSLSVEEKDAILSVFLQEKEINSINNKVNNAVVLFTQPLSEDSYITEEQKIKMYDALCDKLSKYGNVVAKLHPRDKSQYGFQKAVAVLAAGYPSELLLLFPIQFDLAVGVCTSAVVSANSKRGINLNNEFLRTLDASFMDHIDEIIGENSDAGPY